LVSLGQETQRFGGPLISIAAGDKYSNNLTKLFESSSLPQEANELYQQFLGEMLLSSLSPGIEKDAETVLGRRVVFQRRIVVNVGIGLALVAIMSISSICVVLIAHYTSLSRRALNLNEDPGTISAATLLISADQDLRSAFADTDQMSQRTLSRRIDRQKYMLTNGKLFLVDQDDDNFCQGVISLLSCLLDRFLTSFIELAPEEKPKDPRPIVFQGWIGTMLGLFLVAMTAAIIALYTMSSTAGLHQAPFVYQMNLDILQKSTTLAPYKILPTLLALGVKLWFGAVGDTLKLLQPYLSMVKGPVPTTNSVLAEYVNTPIAVATTKALSNSHWTLALVALGALASEFCE
jgi:hypothetical protein